MNNSGKYILIVDDNITNLQLTAILLKDEGFLISLAQSAQAALTQLENLIPDLILLDIMMPGMDGFELCRILKKNEKLCDIPVIFLTAKNQTEDLAEGFRAGGVDYISKPFNRDELLIRVRNHLELSLSRRKIIEMNRSRDRLYSIIAHDIRSPFSSITLTISAIANGYLEPSSNEFREIMGHLEKTTNETLILLDNMLDWTRLQSDSVFISPRLCSVSSVIHACVQLLKGNSTNKKIAVNVDVADDLMAFFDEGTIRAVFRNLIYNAIKFTPENGTIDICAQDNADYVKVSVTDTGVGISEEIVRKIFVNNEHYTSRGTNNEQGSGLGSYIVKDFIEKNKGKIEVVSAPGSGTKILVYLPLMDSL
jgi:two-component system, sensor histidine kinase and response regulator